jgi:hypothetical protein
VKGIPVFYPDMLAHVAVFGTERALYDGLGRMFEELVGDPLVAPHLQRADTVVQYRFADPAATITVDVRMDREPSVVLGVSALVPEVVLSMDADTAHRLFLGEVNLTVALARGQIQRQGPVGKVFKLVPLLRSCVGRYRAQADMPVAGALA